MIARPRNVHILIDWNSELRSYKGSSAQSEAVIARTALKQVSRRIGKLLSEKAKDAPFFIHLRLYHGWRAGFTPTLRRQAINEARIYDPKNQDDRGIVEYSPSTRQVIRSMDFGDRLIGARDIRLCGPRLDHHLPSTLQVDRSGTLGEKMVDTALVSDLLHLAIEPDDSWLIVVGQDSDLVPGILTAEGILHGTDRRIIFLARGGFKNSNPKMMDLICRR